MNIQLAELQRTYRAQRNAARRCVLRSYLIDGEEPTPAAFRAVSQYLYCSGQTDSLGAAIHWLANASLAERARLLSEINTAG
jgi:hypothetical protein